MKTPVFALFLVAASISSGGCNPNYSIAPARIAIEIVDKHEITRPDVDYCALFTFENRIRLEEVGTGEDLVFNFGADFDFAEGSGFTYSFEVRDSGGELITRNTADGTDGVNVNFFYGDTGIYLGVGEGFARMPGDRFTISVDELRGQACPASDDCDWSWESGEPVTFAAIGEFANLECGYAYTFKVWNETPPTTISGVR